MANYTKDEIAAFKKKDQMNCRQSALKAASINNEGKGVSSKDMLVEAQEYYDWLYPVADAEPVKGVDVLPTPTAAQAKVLSKIAAELKQDVETIKPKVLDYAEKNYNMRKYPENVDSVNVFVKALK